MRLPPRPDETRVAGRWVVTQDGVGPDEVEQSVELLIAHHFAKQGQSDEGWSALYRDPADARLWQLSYPESGLHGGGPRVLTCTPGPIS